MPDLVWYVGGLLRTGMLTASPSLGTITLSPSVDAASGFEEVDDSLDGTLVCPSTPATSAAELPVVLPLPLLLLLDFCFE